MRCRRRKCSRSRGGLLWLAILIVLMSWEEPGFGREEATEALPERVDLTRSPAFLPIVRQTHESCAQDAGISMMMTYEWNRIRGTSAGLPENRLAGRFLWNFLNRGENRGAELAEGWRLAMTMGVPSTARYEKHVGQETPLGAWPDGYELYREAMRHRVRAYRFSPLASLEDLQRAKRWLAGTAAGGPREGGLLAIEGRLRGARIVRIGEGCFEAGKSLVLAWGARGNGHVMTYAGYDDRVGVDLNGDGVLTNGRDLDGDGVIGLADWERGAFLAVNSFGREWGDEGKVYVLYRAAAVSGFRRGQWMAGVAVWPEYQPLLTLRLILKTSCQSAVRLRVRAEGEEGGVFVPPLFEGAKPIVPVEPEGPERHSRFVTGKRRLSMGPGRSARDGTVLPVEMGFDLTGRLPFAAEGYILEFRLESPDDRPAEATLLEAALLRYGSDGALLEEVPFRDLPQLFSGEIRKAIGP